MQRGFVQRLTIWFGGCLVLLVIAELDAWLYLKFHPTAPELAQAPTGAKMESQRKMFPDLSEEEIRGMYFRYRQVYAPWVDFRNEDIDTPLVHVKDFLRKTEPEFSGSSEGAIEIFFFGGSTTQGVHVPDNRTLPSAFNQIAAKSSAISFRAFNYGQPYYYLKQETALFLSMLIDGRRPNVAVFLDGINEFQEPGASYRRTPFFSPAYEWIFTEQLYRVADFTDILYSTNLYQALTGLRRTKRMAEVVPEGRAGQNFLPPDGVSTDEAIRGIADAYVTNVKVLHDLCRASGIICLFFLQPAPYLNYEGTFEDWSERPRMQGLEAGYERIKNQLREVAAFSSLDDAFASPSELPYVDRLHYSPYGNRVLAGLIHKIVRQQLQKHD